jgi:hypothetical protein
MALSTFAELKSSIADWLNRDDLTSVIPDFISLAEADFNRKLRHYKMIERVDATLDSRYVQLPANWIETIRFGITSSPTYRLEIIGIEDMLQYRQQNADTAGRPKFYSHVGESIEVFPTPDGEYGMQLTYYESIPALSDSNTYNWLLQADPDIYLYGALLQSAPYLLDDNRIPVWTTLYQNGLASLQKASDDTRFSGSGRRMRITSYS